MALRYPTAYPERINHHVPSLAYAADVIHNAPNRFDFGAVTALDDDGLVASNALVSGATKTFTLLTNTNGVSRTVARWGRCVSITSDAACTRVVTVKGRDYLGQRMSETITFAGAAKVLGKKAFYFVDEISVSSEANTPNVKMGWDDILGLPYKARQMLFEQKNGVVAANAGTFVAGLATGTAATISNADVRGTYRPVTVVPDAANTFSLLLSLDEENLHGNTQFFA